MATRSLLIKLRTEGGPETQRILEELGDKGRTALHRIDASGRPASKSLLAVNQASKEGQQVLRGYAAQAGPVGAVLESMGTRGLVAAASIGAVSLAAVELGRRAEVFQDARNRIKLFSESAQETEEILQGLLGVAHDTRSEFSSTVQLYQRLAQANENLNLEQSELLRITELVNKAVILSGVSAQAASAGIIQFGQALVSGQLRGEELRSVMEQLPALAQTLARGMGVTVGEFRELALEGEVSADKIVQALSSQATRIESDFSKMDVTLTQSFTKLGTASGGLADDINQITGATSNLAEGISTLADAVEELRNLGPSDFFVGPYLPDLIRRAQAQIDEQVAPIQAELPGTKLIPGELRSPALRRVLREEEIQAATGGAPQVRSPTLAFGEATQFVEPSPPSPSILRIETMLERTLAAAQGMGAAPANFNFRNAALRGLDLSGADTSRGVDAALARLVELDRKGNKERSLTSGLDGFREELEGTNEKLLETPPILKKVNEQFEHFKIDMRDVEQQQAQINRIYSEAAGVAGRLVPQMRGFFDAFGSLQSGDPIGATFNALHGVLDLFGVGRNDISGTAQELRRLNEVLRRTSQDARDATLDLGGAPAEELRALQVQATEPIFQLFRQIEQGSGDREFFKDFQELLDAMVNVNVASGAGRLQPILDSLGVDFFDFIAQVEAAFGHTTMDDVARQIFSVRDSFDDLSGSAKRLSSEIFDAQADLERVALRQKFAGDARLGSANLAERNEAANELSDAIRHSLARAEASARRSAGTRSSTTYSSGKPAGDPGSPDSVPFKVGDYDGVIDLSSADKILLDMEDVFRFDKLITPSHWSEVLMPPGAADRIRKRWEDGLVFTDKYGVNGRPYDWSDVISESAIDDMDPIERPYSEALRLTGSLVIPPWQELLVSQGPSAGTVAGLPAAMSVHVDKVLDVTGTLTPKITEVFQPRGSIDVRGFLDMSIALQHPLRPNINDLVKPIGSIDIRRFFDIGELHDIIDERQERNRVDRREPLPRGWSDGF